ncbi:MAG: antitoxin [Stenotrophomonas acidaminiphila]|nr:MAG: antitoxin [Stenotrophomonas acidaminiphila]
MAVEAGSIVELMVEGRTLTVSPARRSLADRLAASPATPSAWNRDEAWLEDEPAGRESL